MTEGLWNELGISLWQAVGIVIDASVLFWVFTFLISYFGQQMRARVTITSFALMTVIGAVTARSMLGAHPTMSAGILVLAVLFLWEGLFRLMGERAPRFLLPVREPRVVLRDGVIDEMALKKTHMRAQDLMVRLRHTGVTRLRDVAMVIVEADGAITVIRAGQDVDDQIVADVVGVDGPSR
ncbi:MAG: DUF421 domain-containing protein [Propionibacteriaceae bacterium]|nr:DUF421 domain-containing protein [Propionibacteriaceae bacterium]